MIEQWEIILLVGFCAAFLLVDFILKWLIERRGYEYKIKVTPSAVICERSDGETECVIWEEIDSIHVEGAYMQGFTLLLNGRNSGCAVPQNAKGIEKLLTKLRTLPGFDAEAISAAMMSQD